VTASVRPRLALLAGVAGVAGVAGATLVAVLLVAQPSLPP
jgi:hypothetical protein